MKYYVTSNTRAQELKKEQLLELFRFATIPLGNCKVPRAVAISDSGTEKAVPTHVKFHIGCKSQPILQTG